MSILQEIIAKKELEIADRMQLVSVSQLEKSAFFSARRISLQRRLQDSNKPTIIAEFKRKSPSKGLINDQWDAGAIGIGYEKSGAAGMSVLTDTPYFMGTILDLTAARKHTSLPLLRKDFIITEYQVVETRSIGADVILLIAAGLKPDQTRQLASLARSLDLEVLLEIHNKQELLEHHNEYVNFIGVNNRNLNDFTVSLDTSLELAEHIPETVMKISESGISSKAAITSLFTAGFKGFLIGEYFMKSADPAKAAADFINEL